MSNTNRSRSNLCWLVSGVCLLSMATGCGPRDGLTLVRVDGTVTTGDSQPFAGGIVRFNPRGKGKLTGGTAVTDDDGAFVIQNQVQRAGLEPGEYGVSFSLYKMPDGSPVPDQDGENEPKSPTELGAIDLVPTEYSRVLSDKNVVKVSKETSNFEFKIPALKIPGKP